MELMDLPDELLSVVVLETMWTSSRWPAQDGVLDMESYERRLSNYPTLENFKEVAFLGRICRRLRKIAISLKKPAKLIRLWQDNKLSIKSNQCAPEVPARFLSDPIAAAVFAGSRLQHRVLSQLPTPAIERLTQLSALTVTDEGLHRLRECKNLVTFVADKRCIFGVGDYKQLLTDLASLPRLEHLTIQNLFIYTSGSAPLYDAIEFGLELKWNAPLTRVDFYDVQHAPFSYFVAIMGKFSSTLQVALFHHPPGFTYREPKLPPVSETSPPVTFPELLRLDVIYGLDDRVTAKRVDETNTKRYRTRAGEAQLLKASPLLVWASAPKLAYFYCSEIIDVTHVGRGSEPDHIAGAPVMLETLDLVKCLSTREVTRRIRCTLDTWEGGKGAFGTNEALQEIDIG